ncbi:MAG: shikimate dehydrogenase [Beijerinckiaceae bacterium]
MRKACIIGYPVKHSRSPMVHGFWLKQHGIAGDYTMAEVAPDDLARFVAAMQDQGFVGGNFTIPHKTRMLELASFRTPQAIAVGAANTLWFENGKPCVDNTDVSGFLLSLDHGAPGWDHHAETALVLGAGGASRAIVYGLIQRGVERVLLANRTVATAEALARDFGPAVKPIHWNDIQKHAPDVDLLVNTTSLGMQGQEPLVMDLQHLPSHTVVSDTIYIPLETDLLVRARLRGLKTVGGLGMLLHQATFGFERWFGVKPEVSTELYDLVAADVLSSQKQAGG